MYIKYVHTLLLHVIILDLFLSILLVGLWFFFSNSIISIKLAMCSSDFHPSSRDLDFNVKLIKDKSRTHLRGISNSCTLEIPIFEVIVTDNPVLKNQAVRMSRVVLYPLSGARATHESIRSFQRWHAPEILAD